MFSRQIIIFTLFCVSCVLSKQKSVKCDLHDDKCLTMAVKRNLLKVISGLPGVETSDPLHLDLLEVNMPTYKYKIADASLSGMKSCHLELLQFYPEEKKYYSHYECEHLIFEAKYETKGKLGPVLVEGNGTCRIDYYNQNYHFNGDYSSIDFSDTKRHIQLENYTLDIEAKGKIHYDFKNLFNGDKVKSDAAHEFANENYQFMDKLIRQPTMEAFLLKTRDNINAFFRIVPVQDVFSY